jgi:hypothetical protein
MPSAVDYTKPREELLVKVSERINPKQITRLST